MIIFLHRVTWPNSKKQIVKQKLDQIPSLSASNLQVTSVIQDCFCEMFVFLLAIDSPIRREVDSWIKSCDVVTVCVFQHWRQTSGPLATITAFDFDFLFQPQELTCQTAVLGNKNNDDMAVIDRRLRPRCCHLESYVKHTSFSCRYIRRGHYVQAWCHKYSTRPLRPSRPWLQEVVPSVCCLQRVFLHAKLKAAYVWASLLQPDGNIEQLVCKYDVIHKTGST